MHTQLVHVQVVCNGDILYLECYFHSNVPLFMHTQRYPLIRDIRTLSTLMYLYSYTPCTYVGVYGYLSGHQGVSDR